MDKFNSTCEKGIQLNGKGLLSKGEVTISISKATNGSGIIFLLKNERIPASIEHVSNANRNTVLSNGVETICLVEHFLAACSVLGVNDIEVTTNKNELIFGDGSAIHWFKAFTNTSFVNDVTKKYHLKETLFVKNGEKFITAIPHDCFKVSYFMDYDHPAIGKLFTTWQPNECRGEVTSPLHCLLRARTFGTKEENDFFGTSDWLLTLEKEHFNKQLHEPLEPVYHKILDIIGDLRLCGINPLEINMHVIGIKSGHTLNVEMARGLKNKVFHL